MQQLNEIVPKIDLSLQPSRCFHPNYTFGSQQGFTQSSFAP